MRFHALFMGIILGCALLWSCATFNAGTVEEGLTTGLEFTTFQVQKTLDRLLLTRDASPPDALGLAELDVQIAEVEDLLFYLERATELIPPVIDLIMELEREGKRSEEAEPAPQP